MADNSESHDTFVTSRSIASSEESGSYGMPLDFPGGATEKMNLSTQLAFPSSSVSLTVLNRSDDPFPPSASQPITHTQPTATPTAQHSNVRRVKPIMKTKKKADRRRESSSVTSVTLNQVLSFHGRLSKHATQIMSQFSRSMDLRNGIYLASNIDQSERLSQSIEDSYSTISYDLSIDHGRYKIPYVYNGVINFIDHVPPQYQLESKPYILVEPDIVMSTLPGIIRKLWRLVKPNVVLSVLCNDRYFGSFEHGNDGDAFQLGLIKAAKLTYTWIVTDGLDVGLTKVIGDAVSNEMNRRQVIGRKNGNSELPPLLSFGVVYSDDLVYSDMIIKHAKDPTYPLEVDNKKGGMGYLNPNHSHYIILKTESRDEKDVMRRLRYSLETIFVEIGRKSTKIHDVNTPEKNPKLANDKKKYQEYERLQNDSSHVAILYHGGPAEIERVLWFLKKEIPVIVIKTQSYSSGLFSYALYEGFKGGDSKHVEKILKPQLLQRVAEAFSGDFQDNNLARNQCRDNIIACIDNAVRNDRLFLTMMDPRSIDTKINDIQTCIVSAIFSSSKVQNHHTTFTKILSLALAWGLHDFATSDVLGVIGIYDFQIHISLFMEALLLPDRADFVDLFLNMGVSLHNFVTVDRMLYLFQKGMKNENAFFFTECFKNITGREDMNLNESFFVGKNSDFNNVLILLTGLKGIEMFGDNIQNNHIKMKPDTQSTEHNALFSLVCWAVLNNRADVAKVLWLRTRRPIALALVISNMYYRLYKYWLTDIDLQLLAKANSLKFGKIAVEMMDVVYKESKILAFRSLLVRLKEFQFLSVVDLALISNNKFFIGHPCCQRSMWKRWYGSMTMKSFSLADVYIPHYIKLFLCLTLVFPIYFWLNFTPDHPPGTSSSSTHLQDSSNNRVSQQGRNEETQETRSPKVEGDPFLTPPLYTKIYYLWTAPITKFWLTQFFFLVYIMLYSYALLLPYCGKRVINLIILIWTVDLLLQDTYQFIYFKMKTYWVSIPWEVLQTLNLVLVLLSHIILALQQFGFSWTNVPYTDLKIMRALALIILFYRALNYLLSTSVSLGPMLVNIKQLISKDLVNWFWLWIIYLVASGVAIHVSIYPLDSFSLESFARAIYRSLITLFTTQVHDLDNEELCSVYLKEKKVLESCNASRLYPYRVETFKRCPVASVGGYLIVSQNIVVTRLIFYTLMFAIFSVTMSKTKEESVEISKFQFYLLVAEFESRPLVPSPFTFLIYPALICRQAFRCIKAACGCCSICARRHKEDKIEMDIPFVQWKNYMNQIGKRKSDDEKELFKAMSQVLTSLENEKSTQTRLTKDLNEHIMHLEQNQAQIGIKLQALLHDLDVTVDGTSSGGAVTQIRNHFASIQSPYPNTDLQRFPLFEENITWNVALESYDPAIYTKPIEEFPIEEQIWVDPDLLQIRKLKEQSVINIPENRINFDPVFNEVFRIEHGDGIVWEYDRRSYMVHDGQPLVYEIDSEGLPRNPSGRTGLRGKGCLRHWGPNHVMSAVISRNSRDNRSSDYNADNGLYVLLAPDDRAKSQNTYMKRLPVASRNPDCTVYSQFCQMLLRQYIKDDETEVPREFDQEDMISFFSQFSMKGGGQPTSSSYATYGFSATPIYIGYLDDERNTDNAWIEREIWHFHYKYRETFAGVLGENNELKWEQVRADIPLDHNDLAAVMEAAKKRYFKV